MLFIITIILLVLVYFIVRAPRALVPIVEDSIPTTHYSCAIGSIDARYGASAVNLALSDGRTFVLPQVVSGSGVRYEKDSTVFISKGDDAFLQEDGTTTFVDCVSNKTPDETNVSGDAVFTDTAETFSFSHPKEFTVPSGGIGYTQEWRKNTQTLGLLLAKMVIPKSVQPQTNFGEATFSIGTSSDVTSVKNCLVPTNGERAKGTATINGTLFNKITLTEAGAGNYYDTTSYRAVLNKQCYVIDYTIHSTNFASYPAELGIKEFDTQKVVTTLEGMVQSFKFLIVDSTLADNLLGKWTGVEGTSLTVLKTDSGYTLNFVMLDGPISVKGSPALTGITFIRDGGTFTLHKGSGADTGMKYLATKKNCVVVQQYEGYCKD